MRCTAPSACHFLILVLPLLPILCADALSSTRRLTTASADCVLRRFYVLRHGQTDHNAAGIIQGSSDVSRLTPLGKEQAARIGRKAFCPIESGGYPVGRIGSIYVSPLTRARETLSAVRRSAPEGVLPPADDETVLGNLREIDFYSWENRRKEDLMADYPEEYAAWKAGGDPDGLVVDGRLPLRETWERAGEVWDEIRSLSRAAASREEHEDGTLLVCHGTLGQALLGSAFGLDATSFRRYDFPNCGMAEILWRDGDGSAMAWRWQHPTPTEHGCLREQLGL